LFALLGFVGNPASTRGLAFIAWAVAASTLIVPVIGRIGGTGSAADDTRVVYRGDLGGVYLLDSAAGYLAATGVVLALLLVRVGPGWTAALLTVSAPWVLFASDPVVARSSLPVLLLAAAALLTPVMVIWWCLKLLGIRLSLEHVQRS